MGAVAVEPLERREDQVLLHVDHRRPERRGRGDLAVEHDAVGVDLPIDAEDARRAARRSPARGYCPATNARAAAPSPPG